MSKNNRFIFVILFLLLGFFNSTTSMQTPSDLNYFAVLPQDLKKAILLQLVTVQEVSISDGYVRDIKYHIFDLRNTALSCKSLYNYFMDNAAFNREAFDKMYTELQSVVSQELQVDSLLKGKRAASLREDNRSQLEFILKNWTLIALGTSQAKLFFDEQCMQGKTDTEKHAYLLLLLLKTCEQLSYLSNPKHNQNCTDTQIAQYKSNVSKVKYEINKLMQWLGADVNMIVDSNNSSLLMYAAKKINKKWAKLLLAKGANINLKDKEGNTALFIALLANNNKKSISYPAFLDLVSLLINAGAQVNDLNVKGLTPLHYALMASTSSKISKSITAKEVVKVLTQKGANCDFRSSESLEVGQPLETSYEFVCRQYNKSSYYRHDWADLKALMEKQQADKKWCVIQ
ncbi:ankyrin repeat domain-containing protein [Candidatus Dependentiae bacterium]|nr:ankyrin repeat domain-containing protein [Candidatus Dependentiae bacterium]